MFLRLNKIKGVSTGLCWMIGSHPNPPQIFVPNPPQVQRTVNGQVIFSPPGSKRIGLISGAPRGRSTTTNTHIHNTRIIYIDPTSTVLILCLSGRRLYQNSLNLPAASSAAAAAVVFVMVSTLGHHNSQYTLI